METISIHDLKMETITYSHCIKAVNEVILIPKAVVVFFDLVGSSSSQYTEHLNIKNITNYCINAQREIGGLNTTAVFNHKYTKVFLESVSCPG